MKHYNRSEAPVVMFFVFMGHGRARSNLLANFLVLINRNGNNMLLGNFGALLLAPFMASLAFMEFGADRATFTYRSLWCLGQKPGKFGGMMETYA